MRPAYKCPAHRSPTALLTGTQVSSTQACLKTAYRCPAHKSSKDWHTRGQRAQEPTRHRLPAPPCGGARGQPSTHNGQPNSSYASRGGNQPNIQACLQPASTHSGTRRGGLVGVPGVHASLVCFSVYLGGDRSVCDQSPIVGSMRKKGTRKAFTHRVCRPSACI
eukprot:1161734-Pelagomonas_calceolata.AAC.21